MRPKFESQSSINMYLGFGYKGLVFCKNNGWLLEKMDKGFTVPKWVLMNWPKISQIPQSLSVQIVWTSSFGFQWKKASLGIRIPWYKTPNPESMTPKNIFSKNEFVDFQRAANWLFLSTYSNSKTKICLEQIKTKSKFCGKNIRI